MFIIIIYIDVLIITSVYVDLMLIKAAAAVLRLPQPNVLRGIAAALAGSLFSLFILLPPVGGKVLFFIKAVSAASMVIIAFGFKSVKSFLLDTAVLTAVSTVFAGICVLLSSTAAEGIIYSENGMVYFNISPVVLIISTAAAYGAIRIFRRFSDSTPKGSFTVTIKTREGVLVSFPAIADTGNRLTDAITGIPVIVCGREQLSKAIPDIPYESDMPKKGWRLIPCETAAGSGLIPIFRPDLTFIRSNETGSASQTEAYIGVAIGPMKDAVFNPSILTEMKL